MYDVKEFKSLYEIYVNFVCIDCKLINVLLVIFFIIVIIVNFWLKSGICILKEKKYDC